MSIIIIKPGMLDTIQDQGRTGMGMIGISPGGAMDYLAARMANILAGNDYGEAVLEMHFPGPQILFAKDALISITGGDFGATLNNDPLASWQPLLVRKNTIMQFTVRKGGARVYLAVNGGFCLEKWLNSYSTHLKVGAGGWHGRKLEKGDELFFRSPNIDTSKLFRSEKNVQVLPWRPDVNAAYHYMQETYFVKGREWDYLTGLSKQALTSSGFFVQPSSDRMGYQLKGHPLIFTEKEELLSSAVSFGTMQLLPDGQLVVLMADHQTTGGYPKIGHVISAHLPKLAQQNPGDKILFKAVEIDMAENLLFLQQQELAIIQRACEDHLNKLVCQ